MGYDRGDSFPFDFEPNGIPFGVKSNGKLCPRSYPIQFEREWKHNFLSAVHWAETWSAIKTKTRGIFCSDNEETEKFFSESC